jgi:predicted Ser/Thr protein kinase
MQLTRERAEALAGSVPRTRGWKASVWFIEVDGCPLIVKDVRYTAPFFRYTFGRFLLWRETSVASHLTGLPFVPALVARIDRDAAAWERVDGVQLNALDKTKVDEAFIARIDECVRALHAAGVVHLDLRHLTNILATPDGRPLLIDFESALHVGKGWFARRVLLPVLGSFDRSSVDKIRVRLLGDRAPEEARRRHERFTRLRRTFWPFGRLWPPSFLRKRRT